MQRELGNGVKLFQRRKLLAKKKKFITYKSFMLGEITAVF